MHPAGILLLTLATFGVGAAASSSDIDSTEPTAETAAGGQSAETDQPEAVAAPANDSAATAVAAETPVAGPPAPAEPAATEAEPSEPVLDVPALKERLKDTPAIGVFTKLALKNQVDDLLEKVGERHKRGVSATVEELRQPYDMLMLKVLALLQDGDPNLARIISASRDVIWGMLADPVKFQTLI
jgi:hypothetical protein